MILKGRRSTAWIEKKKNNRGLNALCRVKIQKMAGKHQLIRAACLSSVGKSMVGVLGVSGVCGSLREFAA
jgi:hypothetical protein